MRALRELLRVVTERRSTGIALLVGAALFAWTVASQLASFPLPVHFAEGHCWRETFTYGVAWNYAHGPLDVLHPRMFVVHAKSNVVPMEPPLYPLLASLVMRVTNDSVIGPRLLSWSGLLASVVVLWRWLGLAARDGARPNARDENGWEERAGLLLALSLSPSIAVDFRQIQPEPLCAGLALTAAWFAARYARTNARRDVALCALTAGLAVLAKPVALGVLPGIVAFGAFGGLPGGSWRGAVRPALVLGLGVAVALVPFVAWDRWSHHLQRTEMDGAFFIAIEHDPKLMFRNVVTMKYAREALLILLPSYAGATWLIPATAAGIHRAFATKELRRYGVPLAIWLIGYMVELLAVGDRLHSNAYYFALAPAPIAFFAALGMGAMLRLLGGARRRSHALVQAGLLVAVLLPASALMVKNWRWSNTTDVAALGVEKNRAMWDDDIGMARLLVSVLVLFAVAPWVRARRLPEPVGLALTATLLGSGAWAVRDRAQWFSYYVAADRRDGWADEVKDLRAAVDHHTRRDDLIVAAPGWTAQSPNMLLFYVALRNGFPVTTGLDPMDVAAFKARGAKLYLRFDQPAPGEALPAMPGTVLASRAWWRLSCIADDGCPALN